MAKKRTSVPKADPGPPKRTHSWRLCPPGEHWVRAHPLRLPPSEKNPLGSTTTRRSHCANNPTGKDQLYPDEILEIAEKHFTGLKNGPCGIDLGFKGKGKKYDHLIAGWTQYWNDVLNSSDPLDPNLVKALIASESGFRPGILAKQKDPTSARGLMQVLDSTRKILGDEKGELKDHYLTLRRADLDDPNVNICAGIRWLFQKRKLAGSRGREATWVETIYKYKGAATVTPKRAAEIMDDFLEYLKRLQECKE